MGGRVRSDGAVIRAQTKYNRMYERFSERRCGAVGDLGRHDGAGWFSTVGVGQPQRDPPIRRRLRVNSRSLGHVLGEHMSKVHTTFHTTPNGAPYIAKAYTRPGLSATVIVGDIESFTLMGDPLMAFYPADVREISAALIELVDAMEEHVE